ncbi:serine/threonine protein kinase [Vibrio agarivorans]|uniref:serine/threonine protein kinase n=1 Tax=Vibrio agarivorans TaxID=153622 RepID=UPI0025B3677A|nr:serine/threonine-protein kinase [Vibrio agarivorans]MDN3662068.1 serine/threonine-protein kinase [Vibrio agarivorans]
MILSASQTEIFYSLIDQPDHVQQQALNLLAQQDSEQHEKIRSMLASEQLNHITQLLRHSASTVCYQSENLVGMHIDKYRLEQTLGQGGFGQVYLAKRDNHTFDQQVAIKVFEPWVSKILSQTPISAQPFQEAHILARLNHPNIAKVYDGGFEQFGGQSTIYIVLEYIEGITLDNHLKQNDLSCNDCLDVVIQMCRAIEHAHYHQILHADIKPSNTIITPDGKVKLIDFNIVHHLHQIAEGQQLSAYSRQFASPEQIAAEPLTKASDIYSLGRTLQHLTASLPFCNDIHQVVQKATEPNPTKRYSSVTHLLRDVENIRQLRPISSRCHDKSYRIYRAIQRHPISMMLAFFAIISVVLLTFAMIDRHQQLEFEEKIASEMVIQLRQSIYDKSVHEFDLTHEILDDFTQRIEESRVIPSRIHKALINEMQQPYPDHE